MGVENFYIAERNKTFIAYSRANFKRLFLHGGELMMQSEKNPNNELNRLW